jgi:hypothetical protein
LCWYCKVATDHTAKDCPVKEKNKRKPGSDQQ